MTRFLFAWIGIINPTEVPTRQLEDLSWRLKKEGELMKTMEVVLYLYWAPGREAPNYQRLKNESLQPWSSDQLVIRFPKAPSSSD